ncbi:chromate transporter [Mycoplasma struthionis]|uniref:Chromate transporter n=1 Tax=Mycoplasma struthionis TaxID=538220 RepID=A0A3G8LIU8_9MOLU|nr:chromate transporter [Mycoplasma struthionis]AZG68588.1 chromate transporter [Mycoplasma struthionis]TPI02324.1 chromate transporter [Mycoplasma struthionis]
MLALLLSIPLLIFVSLSIFGGGQVFMPVFQWMWRLLDHIFKLNITDDKINQVFSIANATPGVVSTKFGLITGYLVANGEWWGYLAMILTYLVFALPAVLMIYFSMKKVNQFSKNEGLKKLLLIMNPVVAGIVIALAIQIIISTMFPYLVFNEGVNNYFGLINEKQSEKVAFFKGWRQIVLYIWVPSGIIMSYIAARKKVPLWAILLSSLIFTFIIFQPWLN